MLSITCFHPGTTSRLVKTTIKRRLIRNATRSSMLEANQGRKLIVGLGNPGSKYNGTRHNIGFEFVDLIAEKYGIDMTKTKFNSIYGVGNIGDQSVVLVKPQTFMNLSGTSVRPWLDYYKVEPRNCLIIHDAADLPTGALRLKLGGTAGGQNGVKSIIEKLGTKEFPRLKLGVGKPERETTDLATWVLSRFHSADKTKIEELQAKAAGCFATWLEHGAEKAMNDFHSEPSTKVKKVKAPKAAANPTSPEASSSAAAIQEG